MMANAELLILGILEVLVETTAITVHPKFPGAERRPYFHCLEPGSSIIIEDPFPPENALNSSVKALTWYFLPSGTYVPVKIYEFAECNISEVKKHYRRFGFWGVMVENVSPADGGLYFATLTGRHIDTIKEARISVARAPVLRSDRLWINVDVDKLTNNVTLECGRIRDLGRPPAIVLWKTPGNVFILAKIHDGLAKLELQGKEAVGTFSCGINTASVVFQCIPEKERHRWEASLELNISKEEGNEAVDNLKGRVTALSIIAFLLALTVVILILYVKYAGKVEEDSIPKTLRISQYRMNRI